MSPLITKYIKDIVVVFIILTFLGCVSYPPPPKASDSWRVNIDKWTQNKDDITSSRAHMPNTTSPGSEWGGVKKDITISSKPIIFIITPQINRGINIVPLPTVTIKGRVKDDSGVKWVTVNGQDADLQSDGNFELAVNLVKGENHFIITTMNKMGIGAEKTFSISHGTQSSNVAKISGPLPNIHALVIGINNYQDDRISRLNFSESDAESFYNFLTDPSRGRLPQNHVSKLLGKEATATSIEKSLKEVVRASSPDDLVIIYLATHGLPDPEGGNELFFLAANSNLDSLLKTAISKSDFEKIIFRYISDRKILLIADTCHSGGLGISSKLLASNVRSIQQSGFRFLSKLAESANGIGVLSASRANELSQENEKWGGGHGVFTFYLLRGLEGEADNNPNDGFVTLREIREYLYEKVSRATSNLQTPELIGSYDANLPLAVVTQ